MFVLYLTLQCTKSICSYKKRLLLDGCSDFKLDQMSNAPFAGIVPHISDPYPNNVLKKIES